MPRDRFVNHTLIASILIAFVVSIPTLYSAPGDVELEILTYTGDAQVGPASNAITGFEVLPPTDVSPVAIDDSGFVSFAAQVETDGGSEYGFYQAFAPGVVTTIMQTDQIAPGLTTVDLNSPNGFRFLDLHNTPERGFGMNKSGTKHAFSIFTRFDGPFLYSATNGSIDEAPITWPLDLSENRSFWSFVDISDGRGTTQFRSGGTSGEMAISSEGSVFWRSGGAIFRSQVVGDIHAIMYTDSPAPGFDESDNPILDAPFAFRGVDALENAIFQCRVTRNPGEPSETFTDAIYRQNFADNSLTLLFVDGETELLGGDFTVTADAQAEDIMVIEDGTVFLRARASSTLVGFYRITIDQEGTISTEQMGLYSSNGFNPVETDRGSFSFRNINLADWAVSENGTVFFTADVVGGEAGSAQEGIWKIDPSDFSVKTVALFGDNADPDGTDASFQVFSDLTAAGEDKLAFTAALSDGNRGLFATDANGGVVKIAIEGSSLVPCEDPQDTSLECRTIESIHFTPDHAGEDLIVSKGSPGLNRFGELAFLATLEDDTTVLVKAGYEGDERPVGTTYLWDGGAGTDDWHTVLDGRGNWKDLAGTPWDQPPGDDGNETVIIGDGFDVVLNQNVSIKELTLEASHLSLGANLEFSDSFTAEAGSNLEFLEGQLTSSSGDFIGSAIY